MRGIMESRGVGILLLLWVSSSAVSGVQTQPVGALQARIDAAAPGGRLTIPARIWPGAITLRHPLTLEAEPGAVIDGRGAGHVVRIEAPGVTLRGFEIRNSGRSFQGDHAAIHVTGHRARIEGNRIRDSLHGIYLKQVKECEVRGNDIVGIAPPPNLIDPASALGDAGSELCDVTPPAPGGPGNGIHLWNSADCLIEANTITRTEENANGEEVEQAIPFMKGYSVFNVEQIEGLPSHYYQLAEPRPRRDLLLFCRPQHRARQHHPPCPLRPPLHVFRR